MWKISEEGRTYLQENMLGMDEDEKYKECPEGYEEVVYFSHGIQMTQYLHLATLHGIMLVENHLYDSGTVPREQVSTIEEFEAFGRKSFENAGLNNLIFMYPKLEEFVEGEGFNPPFDFKGLTIISL